MLKRLRRFARRKWYIQTALPKLAAKLRSPRLAAYAFLTNLRPVHMVSNQGRPVATLVFVDMPGVQADLLAAYGTSDHVSLYAITPKLFIGLGNILLHHSLDDNFYVSSDPVVQQTKDTYRQFLTRTFAHVLRRFDIKAIVSGNFSYYAEKELGEALRPLGISHVVLMKENLKSPGWEVYAEALYRTRRGPFGGTRILTYNEIEKGIEVRAGVAPADRIKVVGMPRLDRIHAWRRTNAGKRPPRPSILMFWFDEKAGLPTRRRKLRAGVPENWETLPGIEELAWKGLQRAVGHSLFEIAEKHSDIQVVIKTKRSKPGRVDPILGEAPPTVTVSVDDDILDLLANASVVAGLVSTALLEAIAAGKPVVVPLFCEAQMAAYEPYLIDYGQAALVASSSEQFRAQLIDAAVARPAVPYDLSDSACAVLKKWTANVDGQSGKRVREALRDIVEPRAGNGPL